MKRTSLSLFALISFAVNISTAATVPAWRPLSPTNAGIISDIETLPGSSQTYYAATVGSGVYKSTDNGFHWQPLPVDGLNDRYVTRIIPLNEQTLFTITTTGTYRSDDAGAHWTRINLTCSRLGGAGNYKLDSISQPDYYHNSHMLSVLDSDHLYLADADLIGKLSASNDGGKNWRDIPIMMDGSNETPISDVVAINQNVLIVRTWTEGLLKSVDGGKHWSYINNGLPTQGNNYYFIKDYQVIDQNTMVVTVYEGVFKTIDGGLHWVKISNGLPKNLSNANIMAQDTAHFYLTNLSDLYETIDGGNNWNIVPTNFTHEALLAMNTTDNGTLLAATNGTGIYQSANDGKSWQQTTGLSAGFINALFPQSEQNIYAGLQSGGMIASHDGGNTWLPQSTGLNNLNVNAISTLDNKTILVGTDQGLFKSIDGGNHFSAANNGLQNSHIRSLLQTTTGLYFAGTEQGLYQSSTGDNWQRVLRTDLAIASLSYVNHTLIATFSTNDPNSVPEPVVLYSDDDGKSWYHNGGFTIDTNFFISAGIFMLPDQTQYAVVADRVYHFDKTLSSQWIELTSYFINKQPLNHILTLDKNIYVSSEYLPASGDDGSYQFTIGVNVSSDGGKTWQDFNNGLRAMGIENFKLLGNTLYVGTQGSDIYMWRGVVNSAHTG